MFFILIKKYYNYANSKMNFIKKIKILNKYSNIFLFQLNLMGKIKFLNSYCYNIILFNKINEDLKIYLFYQKYNKKFVNKLFYL